MLSDPNSKFNKYSKFNKVNKKNVQRVLKGRCKKKTSVFKTRCGEVAARAPTFLHPLHCIDLSTVAKLS